MLKAIAIDDEPLPLDLLQEFCSQTDCISLEKTFTQVNEAKKYLQIFSVDLLFLDIQMPNLSGIDLYKSLKQEVMVIFTTAHSQYAIEGFNLNAVDYLLKPFSFERFVVAVNKANEMNDYLRTKENSDNQNLYIRSNYSLHKISIADILFIESFGDYVDIHFANHTKLTTRMSLKNMAAKLPPKDFMRVHRSFIVPLKRIEKVYRKTIYIAEKTIPIGIKYEEDFLARFRP